MVAYSFQKQFIEPIVAGTKRQTIRATGLRRHARPGDDVQLYTGMRTKHCRLIGVGTCVDVYTVELRFAAHGVIKINGTVLFTDRAMQEFARADGFTGWGDMKAFWAKHHPNVDVFEGVLIRWGDLFQVWP